jgi:hypothetical protein
MTGPTSSQLLQLLGVYSAEGRQKPLDYQQLQVPTDVALKGDQLIWSPGFLSYKRLPPGKKRDKAERGIGGRTTWKFHRPSPEMLVQFAQLGDASLEQIRDFASKWGVLSICRKHWLPSCHSYGCGPTRVAGRLYVYSEPTIPWRHFARQAQALIRNAAAVREGRTPDRDDVETAGERIDNVRKGKTFVKVWKLPPEERRPYQEQMLKELDAMTRLWDDDSRTDFWRMFMKTLTEPPDVAQKRRGDRNLLSARVNTWLGLGNVKPQMKWDEHGPQIELAAGGGYADGLFGHLAIQLMLAASGSAGFVICSACSEPYVAKRMPTEGRLHFCQRCGIKASWKLAQRRRRAARRQA